MFNIIALNISINIVNDAQWIITSRIHEQYIEGCEEHAQCIERLHVHKKYNLRMSQLIVIVSIFQTVLKLIQ